MARALFVCVRIFLNKQEGMSVADIDTMLNKKSGMAGLCGLTDMRDVEAAVNPSDEKATLAHKVYCRRIAKYIGAYAVLLGGLEPSPSPPASARTTTWSERACATTSASSVSSWTRPRTGSVPAIPA
ncbi:hypothetical protein QWU44_09490 [Corynebacterium sp. CCM 9203]